MHEVAIAQSLLEIIVDESKRHGLERIDKVRLQTGKFGAFVPESFRFSFEPVSRDTVASRAKAGQEKIPSPEPSTMRAGENASRLLQSIVRLFLRTFLKASFSASRKAHSQEPEKTANPGNSNRRSAGPCFSTKSAA